MRIQPDQFFLNIAAINQQRRLLQQAFRIHLASDQFLHARLQLSDVGLQNGLAIFLHAVAGLLHVGHALPQLPLDAASFFLAHLVEVIEQLFHLGQNRRLKCAIGRKGGRVQSAGHAQNRIQIGLGRQAELGRGGAKCLNVAAYDLPVEREALGSRRAPD